MTPQLPRLLDVFADDVLELIADKMSQRDRLAFTSTCRRLRTLRDGSTRLWASLCVSGDKPTHSRLPLFLARGPKHVRELVLCAAVRFGGMFQEQFEEGHPAVYDPAVIQSMLISASLVGSRLETLALRWPGELEVGGWVALMPNLRRLCLYPYHEAHHQYLIITTALATLPHLETLCFEADELEMADGCLPPSLRTLCMTWPGDQPLPAAVARATQLHSLKLQEWFGGNLRCIERLAHLTYLGLNLPRDFYNAPPPPLRLSAFPALQCLVLGGHQPYPLALERASSALQQLTYLRISHVTPGNQPSLCANLGMLTSLQTLETGASSPSILTPAVLAGMRQLRAASLHVQTAVTAATVLRALPHLELLNLHLWGDIDDGIRAGSGQAAKPAPAAVAALLDQLASSPALKSLHADRAVCNLLNAPEHRPLFQPALAKLAAADIQLIDSVQPLWQRLVDAASTTCLKLVAEKLDSDSCKLAFTSTCRRLRALRDTSTRLWSSLRVCGDKPTHSRLPLFLARGPKRVRELVLCADIEVAGMFPEQFEETGDPVYDHNILQSMLISASLVGSRLETLVLRWPGELEVGGWVALMPNLRRLSLSPYLEARHQKLTITRSLAELPHLETLCFEAEELEMEDGCLPPSLRTLCMTCDGGPLPPAVTCATQLRSLSLRDFNGELRAIERLRQLTYLRLGARCPFGQAPKALRLAAFPELQGLVLATHDSPYPVTLKGAGQPLQQLTYLELGGVTPQNQRRLCAGLSALTGLQVLNTCWSHPDVLTPAHLSGMRQLRAACLHVTTAIAAAAELRSLPRLQLLGLHRADPGDEAPRPRSTAVAALLSELPSWPALKSLRLLEGAGGLLKKKKHQQLLQAALGTLAAAGIEVQDEADWDGGGLEAWLTAAGAPPPPDAELDKLRMC